MSVSYTHVDVYKRQVYVSPGTGLPARRLAQPEYAAIVWEAGGERFRGLVASVTSGSPGKPPFKVALALNLAHHADFITTFRQTLALSLALGIVLTSLLGWFVARRGLQPVRDIAGLARSISAEHLHDRLEMAAVPAELAELGEAFNAMLARLENSFRRLSDFSSDIAHELRTPVSNLMVQTQVAVSKARSADEYREILYSNLEEYERLTRMVADMLFIAQADNGLIVPECAKPVSYTHLDVYKRQAQGGFGPGRKLRNRRALRGGSDRQDTGQGRQRDERLL